MHSSYCVKCTCVNYAVCMYLFCSKRASLGRWFSSFPLVYILWEACSIVCSAQASSSHGRNRICLRQTTLLSFLKLIRRQHPVSATVRPLNSTFEVAYSTFEQESPAIADKPARREIMPKIAPIRRAYNVVADNTGLSSCV